MTFFLALLQTPGPVQARVSTSPIARVGNWPNEDPRLEAGETHILF